MACTDCGGSPPALGGARMLGLDRRMDTAFSSGHAIPLGLAGDWLARYHGAWWVLPEHGWLCITDKATAADIDHVATRITEVADDASGSPLDYYADLRGPYPEAGE